MDLSPEHKVKIDEICQRVGVDQLLADSPNDFIATVGGPVSWRLYIRNEWLPKAIRRRDNTRDMKSNGVEAVRNAVLEAIYEITDEGALGHTANSEVVADHLDIDLREVEKAIDYLLRKGFLEPWGLTEVGLTASGIDRAEDYKDVLLREALPTTQSRNSAMNEQRHDTGKSPMTNGIFLAHGLSKLYLELQVHLQSSFDVSVQTFEVNKVAGHQVVPTLEKMLGNSSFGVIVATAEDEVGDSGHRARQNVVHEIGLCQGRFGFERTVILMQKGVEPFSNIQGIIYIGFEGNNIASTWHELDLALRKAGFKYR